MGSEISALALLLALFAGAEKAASLSLSSAAFAAQGELPMIYTCEGENISPPLSFGEPPAGTKSFALIVDDPDSPDPRARGTARVHWILYNLPATTRGLPEAIAAKDLPAGTLEAPNNTRKLGYTGPCPAGGKHHYAFRLFALDALLPHMTEPNRAALERAMDGHVLAKVELIGTYRKLRSADR